MLCKALKQTGAVEVLKGIKNCKIKSKSCWKKRKERKKEKNEK